MVGEPLFEILVYTCDQKVFDARLTATLTRQLQLSPRIRPALPRQGGSLLPKLSEGQRSSLRELKRLLDSVKTDGILKQMVEKQFRRQWRDVRYNELVGCIEICTVQTKLRADYWFTTKKRVVVGSDTKGNIEFRGRLLEKEYGHSTLTSEAVFQDFRAALQCEIEDNSLLRRRYIDFRAFDRCGPLVDWRGALQLQSGG